MQSLGPANSRGREGSPAGPAVTSSRGRAKGAGKAPTQTGGPARCLLERGRGGDSVGHQSQAPKDRYFISKLNTVTEARFFEMVDDAVKAYYYRCRRR